MRILVTGAGGFVGRHLVPDLVDAGHEPFLASREEGSLAGLPVHPFDVAERDSVERIVKTANPDAVIHLAGQASVPNSWSDPFTTYRTNVIGTNYLLDALRERQGTRVLLIGSAQQYGPSDIGRALREDDPVSPASPYAISKLAQEQTGMLYSREFGIEVMATRSFNHTGPGQGPHYAIGAFCQQVAEYQLGKRQRIEVGYLGNSRDYLDVRDVVIAYRRLIEGGRDRHVYNVCSGVPRRIGDLLEMLLQIAGIEGAEVTSDPMPREGDPELLAGDPSKIAEHVGWSVKIPMRTSLEDTLAWYRSWLTDRTTTGPRSS
ncbi:MAG: GDP-mannose 4,6-dehydratase [Actinomycetota bacterium]|nr:GDP-mannose 4,6-dehydratase [Actinomycetota bacterium]